MDVDDPKSIHKGEIKPDRISNLLDDIIEQILSHLPIRDAVRTSLLSRKWRYKWAMLPYLVFDGSSLPRNPRGVAFRTTDPVNIIDQVLLLHIGPIQKFKLCYGQLVADSAIDRWVLHLSRSSIKNIVLKFVYSQNYRVPSCLFSCQNLTSLTLMHCVLKPPTLIGFKHLKSLKFAFVKVARDVLENLISSSPVLERLKLDELESFSHLNINAPNLRYFYGFLRKSISFENTFCLAEVTILCADYITNKQNQAPPGNSSNLLNFFYHLPRVQKLDIDYVFLEHLAVGIEPRKLPKPCFDLDYLALVILFNNEQHSITALALLSIAPNLRRLKIFMDRLWKDTTVGSPINFWEDVCWNSPFVKLRLIEIQYFSGTKPELDFIKFMLLNSPVLEKLVFTIDDNKCDEPELLEKQVLNLKRSSEQVEIIRSDCDE